MFYLKVLIVTISSLVCFIIIGCATYKPLNKANQISTQNLIKNAIIRSEGKINIHISIIEDKELAKKYFGIDPLKSKMVPVAIKIDNNGEEIIKLDILSCHLVTDTNVNYYALSIEEAITRALRSDASVIGWTIGFGLVGGLIAGDKAASTNKTLEEDYHAKYFKPTLINRGSSGEGIIFYDFSEKVFNHIESSVITISKLGSEEKVQINIKLSDYEK
jgi:hypothetical protein